MNFWPEPFSMVWFLSNFDRQKRVKLLYYFFATSFLCARLNYDRSFLHAVHVFFFYCFIFCLGRLTLARISLGTYPPTTIVFDCPSTHRFLHIEAQLYLKNAWLPPVFFLESVAPDMIYLSHIVIIWEKILPISGYRP